MVNLITTHTIKQLLTSTPKTVFPIKYDVKNSEILNIWKSFKKNNTFMKNPNSSSDLTILSALHFHLQTNVNHIILYFGLQNEYCLLLCKINGKYINMTLPHFEIKQYHTNFIATYCE